MNPFSLCILLGLSVASFAQGTRIELLSRSEDHGRRVGASALAAVPEFSRDGNFVLFLSEASNLATNMAGGKPVLNLFMTDRRTGVTTLLSQGANGEPANENIINFELSADNKRVLIETDASNLIANDTNNRTDVFVRDLALNTNILVSANTNGNVSWRGAGMSTMSADGKFVAFTASDKVFTTNQTSAFLALYVRDIDAGTAEMAFLPVPSWMPQFFREPSLSPDGRYVAFISDYMRNGSFYSGNFLFDRQTGVSVKLDGEEPNFDWEPVLSGDGKFVVFGTQSRLPANPVTNIITRYSVELGTTELVVSNTLGLQTRPLAVSHDGSRVLYLHGNSYKVYRDGAETRAFPLAADGSTIQLPSAFSTVAMSGDGRTVTFTTTVPLRAVDGEEERYRTYLYDVEEDALQVLPLSSSIAPASDPVPNFDGSLVVFTAAEPGIQEEWGSVTQNIYVWERASGVAMLLSRSHRSAFENSDREDSKLAEFGSISDDGTKLVYTSYAPAQMVADTNGVQDVFVLDRVSGRKELVSVATDGVSAGSGYSFSPVISGNGRMVAFLSRATNLVNAGSYAAAQVFVRDLQTRETRMITNTNGEPSSGGFVPGSFSFDRAGTRLAFTGGSDLEARSASGWQQVYIYNVTNRTVSLLSYNTTGTAGASRHSGEPVLSPDGKFAAFRSLANDFGVLGNGVLVRDLTTGIIKRPGSPNGVSMFATSLGGKLLFDPSSTTLFYSATGSVYQAYNVAQNTQVRLATGALEASVSTNQRWVAFSRPFPGTFPPRTQIVLRDTANGVETVLSSRTAGHVGDMSSTHPKISPDGRFVVFQSRASDLVQNDRNGRADIFIYDRGTATLTLVSKGIEGGSANSASVRTVMSPDNSFAAFVSYASDLVSHDRNGGADIFAAHFAGPDTDADSIDDRWETLHFGSLTHDMTLDSDADGFADGVEFTVGTDPEAAGSAIRVVSATVEGEGTVVVRWAAAPGRSYRVQARGSFDAASAWEDLSGAIVASGMESSIELPVVGDVGEIYFRIVAE